MGSPMADGLFPEHNFVTFALNDLKLNMLVPCDESENIAQKAVTPLHARLELIPFMT